MGAKKIQNYKIKKKNKINKKDDEGEFHRNIWWQMVMD